LVAFCIQATSGWPLRRVQVLLALGMLVLSVRVPLSTWTGPGTDDHAPFLRAVQRVELGDGIPPTTGAVAVAGGLCSGARGDARAGLASSQLAVDDRGYLLAHGRPLRGPLVVDGFASTVVLEDARVIAAAPNDRLWLPRAAARLRLYVIGRSADGFLSGRG